MAAAFYIYFSPIEQVKSLLFFLKNWSALVIFSNRLLIVDQVEKVL